MSGWVPYHGMYEIGAELRNGCVFGRVDRPDCDLGWQWRVGTENYVWQDGECSSLEEGKRFVEEWLGQSAQN